VNLFIFAGERPDVVEVEVVLSDLEFAVGGDGYVAVVTVV
jgi:hypothetical protein